MHKIVLVGQLSDPWRRMPRGGGSEDGPITREVSKKGNVPPPPPHLRR